jgi:high-affinity nickel-transport protein
VQCPWNRRDRLEVAAIGLLHLVGFGALVLIVAPHRYQVGAKVFGIGLGVTAYT